MSAPPALEFPSTSNVGTDETTGIGYTPGGIILNNVNPALIGSTAIVNFSPNPVWTSATFQASACIIYNASTRLGVAGRAVSVHDFGGVQIISSGTFTVLMPPADANNAILRIG